jgi:hypothetical protein
VFFPAARAYFTGEEDQAMLARFWEFDQTMIPREVQVGGRRAGENMRALSVI